MATQSRSGSFLFSVFSLKVFSFQACHTTLLAQPYCGAYRECHGQLKGVLSNPTRLPPGSTWVGKGPGNCSAQCGAEKVWGQLREHFKSVSLKEIGEECGEGRVSYCRLPQPHTTCRLTQVEFFLQSNDFDGLTQVDPIKIIATYIISTSHNLQTHPGEVFSSE